MRKTIIHILTVLSVSSVSWAQSHTKYWIQFTDKNASPYTVFQPGEYLSEKAVQRRKNQSISVNETDLPVLQAYIDSVVASGNVKLLNRSKWFNAITIQTTDSAALQKIYSFPFVATHQPVAVFRRTIDELQRYQKYSSYQRLVYIDSLPLGSYGHSLTQVRMIGADCMHDKGYKGEGMIIAVLDAGFLNADTLVLLKKAFDEGRILGSRDFVEGGTSVYEDHNHGTNVLSTMAADKSGVMIGTAPMASYWLLRTEDAVTEFLIEEDNWIAAAEFADSVGVDIINTSLGYTTFDDTLQDHTYNDMDGNSTRISIAADMASAKGLIVVVSAGNQGSSAWKYVGAPADADSVLTVGAVDPNGKVAPFSSRGPTFDGRIKPDVSAQGMKVLVANPAGGTYYTGGTSFSSPLTAGAVACLWQANPNKSSMDIINAVKLSGSSLSNPNNDVGYGIPNFCIALQSLNKISEVYMSYYNILQINTYYDGTGYFSFDLYSDKSDTLIVHLFDMKGAMLLEKKYFVEENTYTVLKLKDIESLAAGMYILHFKIDDYIRAEKIIKAFN